MLNEIRTAFERSTFLSPKDLLSIASITRVKSVKAGDYVLKEGDVNYNINIVVKGLFRHYVVDDNGIDKTVYFSAEKDHFASPKTFLHDMPSEANIVALENSIILRFDFRAMEKLSANNIRLLKLQNKQLKKVISSNADQIKFLTVYSPELRYEHFRTTSPKLEQRIKQKYLASYLGVTPTSLSRIRRRSIKK